MPELTEDYVLPGMPVLLPEGLDLFLVRRVRQACVPPHMHEGIILYLRYGVPTGSFLEAVLSNDAARAVQRADPANLLALGNWFVLLCQAAPLSAWGDAERYEAWIQQGHDARQARTQPSASE